MAHILVSQRRRTPRSSSTPTRAGMRAGIIDELAGSPAAQPDLSVSNEGTVLGPFGDDPGAFIVNWTFIYNNYPRGPDFDDIGWARYPQTIEGEDSKPPIGGINMGVSAFSSHTEEALNAVECITSEEQPDHYAVDTANMPAKSGGVRGCRADRAVPRRSARPLPGSIDTAGPRPPSPFWSTIVDAILDEWHPADGVSDSTPAESSDFVQDVLNGEALTLGEEKTCDHLNRTSTSCTSHQERPRRPRRRTAPEPRTGWDGSSSPRPSS